MALTDTELLRIRAIETTINTLQTAANNLATRKELKNLLAILQQQVTALGEEVEQLELTGSGSALANHKIDPDAHSQLDARYFREDEHVSTSTGATDAGKPITLSSSGVLDSSLLPGGGSGFAGDHGVLGGLSDDDHTQYHTDVRGDARYFLQSEFLATSAGISDADKPVKLSSSGVLDSTLLPGGTLTDHGLLGGLSDDDHPQYLTEARAFTALVANRTTQEAITISVNPVTGIDTPHASYPIISTQAEATARGPFKTIHTAAQTLPPNIRHRVVLQVEDGTYTAEDPQVFGDLSRFSFGYGDLLDSPDGYGQIAIKSASGLTRVSGTSTYAASAGGASQFTLGSTPFADNTYQGYYVRVISGGGAGQVKAIRSHIGTTWKVAGQTSISGTSVIEIVKPAVSINLDASFGVWMHGNHFPQSQQLECLHLEDIDLVCTEFAFDFQAINLSIAFKNTRVINLNVLGTNAFLTVNNAIFDGQDSAGSFALVLIKGGYFRAWNSQSSWIIRAAAAHGLRLSGGTQSAVQTCTAHLFEGAIDDNASSGLVLEGPNCTAFNATRIYGTGNGAYGVRMLRQSYFYIRLSDFASGSEYLRGDLGELNIDGAIVSYADVTAESDKVIIGQFNSVADGNQPLVP
jgi:hypothetical protein